MKRHTITFTITIDRQHAYSDPYSHRDDFSTTEVADLVRKATAEHLFGFAHDGDFEFCPVSYTFTCEDYERTLFEEFLVTLSKAEHDDYAKQGILQDAYVGWLEDTIKRSTTSL